MAAGDLVVAEQQLEIWRSDTERILFGAGTKYDMTSQGIKGLSVPATRTQDDPNPSDHGEVPGIDLYEARRVTGEMHVFGDDSGDLSDLLNEIGRIFQPKAAESIFTIRLPGQLRRRLYGKPRRADWPHDRGLLSSSVPVGWEFVAHDPRIYDHVASTEQITIADAGANSTEDITNSGNFPMEPLLTIIGPATNPRILNADDGNRSIKIDVVLDADDELVIDIAERTITLNGVDAYNLRRFDNQWWELLPGANTIQYSRTGAGVASTLTIDWRHCWNAI